MGNIFDPYYNWLGIQPNDQPPDYYRLLGIELFESDQNVIANAANQRFVYVHSFLTGEYAEISQKLLDEITAAGTCLLNRKTKAAYDREMKSQLFGLHPNRQNSPVEIMSFIEPSRTDKNKTNNRKRQFQIGPAILGILIIAGIVVTAFSIFNNLRNLSEVRAKETANNNDEPLRKKDVESQGKKTKINEKNISQAESGEKVASDEAYNREKYNKASKSNQFIHGQTIPESQDDALKIYLQQQIKDQTPADKHPELDKEVLKKIFDLDVFDVDVDGLADQLNKNSKNIILLEYPDGRSWAMAMHDKGILHGASIAFYKNGQPMSYATYNHGSRDGIVKTWSELGEDIYWCQYKNGDRNGLCCFLKSNQIQIVVKYKRENVIGIYLLSGDNVKNTFFSSKEADDDSNAKILLEELKLLESELKTNEIKFKRQVSEEEDRQRWQKVHELNQMKREAIQERIKQRQMEFQKMMESIRNFNPWKRQNKNNS